MGTLKIVSWNCNGGFVGKVDKMFKLLGELKPDVLVVQECEENITSLEFFDHNKCFWYADEGEKKGVGVFLFSDYEFELSSKISSDFRPGYKYILPLMIKNSSERITLFAIWTKEDETTPYRYPQQVSLAIDYYKPKGDSIILVGDFNSNAKWDADYSAEFNHSKIVEKLNSCHIYSVYHRYFNCEHGQEKDSTFFLYRHKDKHYHIDYCFASEKMVNEKTKVTIGDYNDWVAEKNGEKGLSDHCPIIVTFDFP